MNIVNRFKLSAAALALAAAMPAAAQQAGAQAAIAPGAIVKDDKGGEVGTLVRIEGDNYVVKTDRHEVTIAKTSMTPHEGTLLFGMTREQLNAAVDKQVSDKEAAIKPGAAVFGAAGNNAGTIEAVDAEYITLKLASGKAVRLPRNAVGLGANGLVTGLTAEQLEAAAGSNGDR
jgi:preprotein translocase subunit YajC